MVPGVVLIDRILDAVAEQQSGCRIAGIHKLKFLRPLLPEQDFHVHCAEPKQGRLRFRCLSGDELLAEGSLLLESENA